MGTGWPFNRHGFSPFFGVGVVLELDNGNGYTTLFKYYQPVNCILSKNELYDI